MLWPCNPLQLMLQDHIFRGPAMFHIHMIQIIRFPSHDTLFPPNSGPPKANPWSSKAKFRSSNNCVHNVLLPKFIARVRGHRAWPESTPKPESSSHFTHLLHILRAFAKVIDLLLANERETSPKSNYSTSRNPNAAVSDE